MRDAASTFVRSLRSPGNAFRTWRANRRPGSLKQGFRWIRKDPTNLGLWLDLFALAMPELEPTTRELIEKHALHRGGVILNFQHEIMETSREEFIDAAKRLDKEKMTEVIDILVSELVRQKTVIQCRDAHREGGYYASAEPFMESQWERTIWPIISGSDFTSVLELAPGHGRNTEKLRRIAKSITLVDVNRNCIEACRKRFGQAMESCSFHYFVNNGRSLSMVADESISFVYTFDSMVHFDKSVVREYVQEIARILQPGGKAFLHHSNYGSIAPNSDWAHNPGNRSDMSAEIMRQYAQEQGLEIAFQRLSGTQDGWGIDDLDVLTLLRRPSDA